MAGKSNFGDILGKWERICPDQVASTGDEDFGAGDQTGPSHRVSPAKLRADMTLDLHGLTVAEAEFQTSNFLAAARREGAKKVLIVHGKGIHSAGGAVLGKWLQTWLEKQKGLGARGPGSASEGGSGATWVVLKYQD